MLRSRNPSLQVRLAWRLGLVLLAGVCIPAVGVVWEAARTIDSLHDRALQAQADDIARHLSIKADGTARLELPTLLKEAYQKSDGSYLYVVFDRTGHPAFSSPFNAGELIQPWLPSGPGPSLFQIGADPEQSQSLSGYVRQKDGFLIAVAQGGVHDDALADGVANDLIAESTWVVIPVLTIALWVGVMTIRSSLRPLVAASAEAQRIGPHRSNLRLPVAHLPREVRPLVIAVNGALDRLERGFEQQRRFTANVAHELRSPLSVLTVRLDLLERHGAVPSLRRDVDRMNRLVEQLLRIARLEAEPLDVSREIDLRQIAVEAVTDLAPLAVRHGRNLVLSAEAGPVLVRGNGPALVGAVTNLIENAIAHAPVGGCVEVGVCEAGAICVKDDGPGIPSEQRHAIFERFWRGQHNRARGAGLGLAIVQETVRAHGGSVEVAEAPGGGALFSIRLRVSNAQRAI